MEARIPKGKVRTRFAPSPTGYMHVGNLRTALYTWLIARHAGGTFILRIEDTDQGRLVEGATDVIYRTMKECRLDHDEGPDVGGPTGPYIQSERRDLYLPYAQLLVEKGAAYYCFCEKAESEEDSGDFDRADDPCRNLSAGRKWPPIWLPASPMSSVSGSPTRAPPPSTTCPSVTSPWRTRPWTIRCC